MSKVKNFTPFEQDFVRLMVHRGYSDAQIASLLNRTKIGIYQLRKRLERAGTLAQLPLPIAEFSRAGEAVE